MAIGRLAISTADSAKMRRRRDGREANPQAAKLSNWMVRAEKGESPGEVGGGGRGGERDFLTSHSEVSDSLPTTHLF